MWRRFILDESGATSIEYALMGSMFALMALAAYSAMGEAVNDMFGGMSDSIEDATASGS